MKRSKSKLISKISLVVLLSLIVVMMLHIFITSIYIKYTYSQDLTSLTMESQIYISALILAIIYGLPILISLIVCLIFRYKSKNDFSYEND